MQSLQYQIMMHLRFETGIRTLKVTDTATVDSPLSTTSAFTNFMANGSLTSHTNRNYIYKKW